MDWSQVAATGGAIITPLLALWKWISGALATRDIRITELEKQVIGLQAKSNAISDMVTSSEGRQAAAMEGIRTDIKHMSDRLDKLFTLLSRAAEQ